MFGQIPYNHLIMSKWCHIGVSLRCAWWQTERGLLNQIYETQSSDLSPNWERERERGQPTRMNEEEERLRSTSWACGVYESHWLKHKTNTKHMSTGGERSLSYMCFCQSNNMPHPLHVSCFFFFFFIFLNSYKVYSLCLSQPQKIDCNTHRQHTLLS